MLKIIGHTLLNALATKDSFMTKTYSCINDLPEEVKPLFLHPRNTVIIPSPAFDITKRPFSPGLKPKVEKQWAEAEKSDYLLVAHALSCASQRRILEAYYVDANNLSAEQLILYAPFTVLAVRQLISGSLIDIKSRNDSSLTTRNGIGFLFKVPPSCIYVVSPIDANVPMEKEGVLQRQFRDEICELFNQSPIAFSPADILSITKNDSNSESYNEIAFVPRTVNPAKSISLVGIFIDPNNLNFGRQGKKSDIEPASFYFDSMIRISHILELPLINL